MTTSNPLNALTESRVNDDHVLDYKPNGDTLLIRKVLRNKSVLIGGTFSVLVVVLAVLAPFLAPYSPYTMHMSDRLLGPFSGGHLLGTDEFGRDLLTRLLFGARSSLTVGFLSVAIALLVGVPVGVISGYYGGWIDMFIMRIVDIVLSFPFMLLAIALVAALGPGISNVILALALVYWTNYARIVRASVLAIKEEEYVQAVRTVGSNDFRIIMFSIMPNCLAPIIVIATLGIGQAIVAEATMSFLGLGVQPPQASWGWILAYGMKFIENSPYLSIFPGIAIMITVLGFNLLGDGVRDLTDTKL